MTVRVSVYRESLLLPSETFIANQVRSYRRVDAELVGLNKVNSSLTNGIETRVAPMGRWRASLMNRTSFASGVDTWLNRERPDLVHVHFLTDAATLWPALSRLKVPYVLTCHGWDVTLSDEYMPAAGAKGRAVVARRTQVFDKAALVICVSEFIRGRVIALGCDPAKAVVHHIGVPTAGALCETDSVNRYSDGPIVFVGRLVEQKGAADLIRAVAQNVGLKRRRLVIIGDGPMGPHLKQLSAALNVEAQFLGTQPNRDVQSQLRSAAVFCGPSRNTPDGRAEGFGMVFLEAALAGCPVVAYETGGVPEAVSNGTTGILVPHANVERLGHALSDLLADVELARALGKAGQERVQTQFSISQRTAELESLYLDILFRTSS